MLSIWEAPLHKPNPYIVLPFCFKAYMTSWVVTVRQILYSTRHRPILNEPADVSYQ
jgi:hypothetical protein